MPRLKQWRKARLLNFQGSHHEEHADDVPAIRIIRPLEDPFVIKIRGKLLAFGIIVHGGNYEQIKQIIGEVGILTVERSAFDKAQKEVCKALISAGEASIAKWREAVKDESMMCIDGCWDHPRNGQNCVVSFFDNQNWKIIALEVVQRGVNYDGPSNGMEAEGIERVIEELKNDNEIRRKFIAYCHDCDGKVRTIFRRSGWDLKELLDINHAMKSFGKSFNNVNVQNGGCLTEIYIRLKLWIFHIIETEDPEEIKVAKMLNAAEHFTGNHSNCDHEPSLPEIPTKYMHEPHTKEILINFLNDNLFLVKMCNIKANTQHNESFNAVRARFAPKSTSWKDSFKARTMAAVLDVNEFGTDWRGDISSQLKLQPLTQELQERFDSITKHQKELSEERRKKEFQDKERIRRLKRKNKLYKLEKNCTKYNINHIPFQEFTWNQDSIDTFVTIYSRPHSHRFRHPEVWEFFIKVLSRSSFIVKDICEQFIITALDAEWTGLKPFFQIIDEIYAFAGIFPPFDLIYSRIAIQYLLSSDPFISHYKRSEPYQTKEDLCIIDITEGNPYDNSPYTIEIENIKSFCSSLANDYLSTLNKEKIPQISQDRPQFREIVKENSALTEVRKAKSRPYLCYP